MHLPSDLPAFLYLLFSSLLLPDSQRVTDDSILHQIDTDGN